MNTIIKVRKIFCRHKEKEIWQDAIVSRIDIYDHQKQITKKSLFIDLWVVTLHFIWIKK